MTASSKNLRIGALALALSLSPIPAQPTANAQTPAVVAPLPGNTPGIYQLDQFGPINTAQAAQAAFDKADSIISAAGGGIIIIPRSAPAHWHAHTAPPPLRRGPAPPPPAAKWGTHPGVSVYDLRTPDTFYTAQTSGIKVLHQILTPRGQPLPIGQDASLGTLNNQILRGTSSYSQPALSASPAGQDKTVTLPTIQGLFPGQTLVFGDKSAPGSLTVKSLAYDPAAKTWSVTGDLSKPLAKGDLLQCITQTGVFNLQTLSNNENQTFDLMVWHHNFANSSRNLVKASFKYQGDNIPSAPDKGTVLFGATTTQLTHPFEGHVESMDGESGFLVYKPGATATDTIGSGRPIINMNPAKQIKAKANIYSNWGSIELTQDAPITKDMIGWYMAIDEPAEAVPGTNARRWWPISGFTKNKDGMISLYVLRYWWGAHAGRGIGELYTNLWSSKETSKVVNILIAPGANVYDASDAVQRPEKKLVNPKRLIKLVPRPMTGTPNDFAPGDPIAQAIGPDPWHPAIFRSWLFESVPGIGPTPIFDVQNIGPVARGSVMHVRGGSTYDAMMVFQTGGPIGIRFQKEVPAGALVMNAHPDTAKSPLYNGIVFTFPGEDKKTATYAGIGTDLTGLIKLWSKDRKGINLANQNITGVTGLNSNSGNFRALALPIPEGKTSHELTFPKPESSPDYAMIIRPNWITNYAVQTKTPQGVTIIFDKPAPKDATIDWLLVR
jgi:hypothetical protein